MSNLHSGIAECLGVYGGHRRVQPALFKHLLHHCVVPALVGVSAKRFVFVRLGDHVCDCTPQAPLPHDEKTLLKGVEQVIHLEELLRPALLVVCRELLAAHDTELVGHFAQSCSYLPQVLGGFRVRNQPLPKESTSQNVLARVNGLDCRRRRGLGTSILGFRHARWAKTKL